MIIEKKRFDFKKRKIRKIGKTDIKNKENIRRFQN